MVHSFHTGPALAAVAGSAGAVDIAGGAQF